MTGVPRKSDETPPVYRLAWNASTAVESYRRRSGADEKGYDG